MQRNAFFYLSVLWLSGCGLSNPFTSPSFLDRSVVGNGTDLANDELVAAWYLGDEPIRYCVRWHPDFGLPKDVARWNIRESFDRWARYLEKKKLNEPRLHEERRGLASDPALRMRGKDIGECDGTEELTFWLGAENEKVKSHRQRYDRPIAFAERGSYNLDTARGSGFIWIASAHSFGKDTPSWKYDGSSFSAIVMHELGHVAGTGHVDGTIMDPRILRLANLYASHHDHAHLQYQNIFFIDLWGFTRKERYRELFLCDRCEFKRPGWNLLKDHRTFERFVGSPVPEDGYVIASIDERKENDESLTIQLWARPSGASPGELPVAGGNFVVKHWTRTATTLGDGVVFRLEFRRPGEKNTTTIDSRTEGYVAHGTLRTKSGEKITVIQKRNMYGETMRFDWVDDDGQLRPIYELNTVLKSYGITL